ncbi:hypothetical protein WS72_21390 [Burkholderia savannae]|uniref:Uncharacterized protein n=1 Tax=Burkholderia savannae TaxID=1637837 RepID=A0ABR5T2R5_9BURK|nr:hypothetical protein WS72_21390 [Burkholderia savannae]
MRLGEVNDAPFGRDARRVRAARPESAVSQRARRTQPNLKGVLWSGEPPVAADLALGTARHGTAPHRTARLSLDDAAATRRAYPIARCRGAPCRWSAHRLHSLLAALRVRRALQSAMRSAPACRARAPHASMRGGGGNRGAILHS